MAHHSHSHHNSFRRRQQRLRLPQLRLLRLRLLTQLQAKYKRGRFGAPVCTLPYYLITALNTTEPMLSSSNAARMIETTLIIFFEFLIFYTPSIFFIESEITAIFARALSLDSAFAVM